MKINAHKLATASSLTVALFYGIYTLLMMYIPEKFIVLMMKAHYVSADSLPMLYELTIQNGIYGLIIHIFFVYLFVWLTATLYNILS